VRRRAGPRAGAGQVRLAAPAGVSLALHAAAVLALLVTARSEGAPPRPPMYRVDLVAAPPGPRAEGVVTPTPPAATPPVARPAAPPPRPQSATRDMPLPRSEPPRRAPPAPATPTPAPAEPAPAQPAAPAGGGPSGGHGTDVANVSTPGIEFPYRGYLENIVRQVAKSFVWEGGGAPRAEVSFLIHRDGRVSDIRITARSGVFKFDQEALGAIEAAKHAFGPLPGGYPDDVLPIIFSFDPRTLR
jgi:protein TonB